MAVSRVSISEAKLCCAICLELLKSPATIPCGHNFCMECIGRCWHQDGSSETFRCPQCRETFNSRPSLSKNTILCEIVEDFTNSDAQSTSTSKGTTDPRDVLCDFCTDQKLEAVKSCVVCMASYCQVHLQPHASNPVFKDHQLIDPVKDIDERKCPKHRKPLELYCRTDQMCVCCLCAINEHRQHETVSLEEQVSELKYLLFDGRRGNIQELSKVREVNVHTAGLKAAQAKYEYLLFDGRRGNIQELSKVREVNVHTAGLKAAQAKYEKELHGRQEEVDTLIQETTGEIGKLNQKVNSIKQTVGQVKQQAKQKCTQLVAVVEKTQRDVLRFLEEEEGGAVGQVEESIMQLQSSLAGLQQNRMQLEAALKSEDNLFVLQEHECLNKPTKACFSLPCQDGAKFLAVERAMSELSHYITQQLHICFNPHLDPKGAKDLEVSVSLSPPDTCVTETKPDSICKRAEYLHNALRLTFDPNTAHKHLLLSEDSCTVTDVDPDCVPYPEHLERFNGFPQVLCAQGISEGCCYWEVEVNGHWAGIGITYRGIRRKGSNMSSLIGRNDLSWCLLYSNSKFSALHNKQEVILQSGRQQRIGIHLDYPEGILDFFGIGTTMSLIYRFKTVFTEPVYPAFFVFLGTSLSICQLS